MAEIDQTKLPRHVAIIMDGNGRWAKKLGNIRIFGHQSAIKAVRETVECAAEIGIEYLTLYAFSTENWSRPQKEVNALMELLVSSLQKELKTLQDNKIKLQSIGNLQDLPEKCQKQLQEVIQATAQNDRMTLILALSYGAKNDMIRAIKELSKRVKANELDPEDINEQVFSEFLSTHNFPDPELMIRTSGEQRISNFLLWELAYAELYFTPKLWPDFRKQDLIEAILDFQKRERRFGKTSEQLI